MLLKLIIFITFFIPVSNASDSFSYSGRLVTNSGEPATGPAQLTFDIIYSSQPSNILCSQTLNQVELSSGVFHVKLDFPSCDLADILKNTPDNHTVSIRVTDKTSGLNKEYSYQAIHAVPYAFVSQTTKQLDSLDANKDEVLTWDGSKWGPAALSDLIPPSGPVGEAGGALTGTYPNPELAPIAQTNVVDLVSDLASKIGLGSLSATPPLLYNNTTGVFSLDTSATEKLDDLEYLPAGDGLVVRIGSTLFSKTCMDDEVLKWTSPGGWICASDENADDTKLPLAGGTLTGDLILGTQLQINNGLGHSVVLKTALSDTDYILTLPPNAGAANQVLTTDGNGVLTWETPAPNAPSGPASGDLEGDYPAPTLKDIPQSKIIGLETELDSKIGLDNLSVTPPLVYSDSTGLFSISEATTSAAGTLSAAGKTKLDSLEVLPGALGLIERWSGGLRSLTCLQDQVLKWNGAIWACAADDDIDGTKLPLSGGELTGPLVLPAIAPDSNHAVARSYVDTLVSNNASKWSTATGGINYDGGNVGIGTATPETSAILDLNSTSKGFLPPRMTTLQRDGIISPVKGMMIFNSGLNKYQFYDGSTWTSIASGTGGAVVTSYGESCLNCGTKNKALGNHTFCSLSSFGESNDGNSSCNVFSDGSNNWTLRVMNKITGNTTSCSAQCIDIEVGAGSGGSGGGSDNMGDHVATANIALGMNWLSGDGDNEGLSISNEGLVGLGTSSPKAFLHVSTTPSNYHGITISSEDVTALGSGALTFESTRTSSSFQFYTWNDEFQFTRRKPNGEHKSNFLTFSNHSGFVGIGKGDAKGILDVAGHLIVTGSDTIVLDGTDSLSEGQSLTPLGLVFTDDIYVPTCIWQDSDLDGDPATGTATEIHGSIGCAQVSDSRVSTYGYTGGSFILGTSDLIIDSNSDGKYSSNGGNVGIGTAAPTRKLEVAGIIKSSSGGIELPDGTLLADANDIGGSFPDADFDSGWVNLAGANALTTVTHNLERQFFKNIIIYSSCGANTSKPIFTSGVTSSGTGQYGYIVELDNLNSLKVRTFPDGGTYTVQCGAASYFRVFLWK